MIVISETGFAATVYRISHFIWRMFCGDRVLENPSDKTNLCTLVRTIILLAPLALGFNALAVGSAVSVLGYFLFILWLNATTVGVVFVAVTVIALVGVIIYFFGAGLGKLTILAAESETTGLAIQYVKAKKARICPLIQIKENLNEAA